MKRRTFIAGALASPLAALAGIKMVVHPYAPPPPSDLELAMNDAWRRMQANSGQPDIVYVNQESYDRLKHEIEHDTKDWNRDRCPTCLAWKLESLKRRLLAKHRPQPVGNLWPSPLES